MSKLIQVRRVPDEVHRTLKARASQAGLTLSDYVLQELVAVTQRPTLEEMLDRLERRGATRLTRGSAAAVRAEREAHE